MRVKSSLESATSKRGPLPVPIQTCLIALLCVTSHFAAADIMPAARRISWDAGVRDGIPQRSSVCANVRNAPYSARGDGNADDTRSIQSAIDSCPANGVVYLPNGTYKITSPLRIRSGVTVRGDGIGKTIVRGASAYTSRWLIGFEDPAYDWNLTQSPAKDLASGYTKDSKTIATATAHNWTAGDIILIDQLEDPSADPPITNDGTSLPTPNVTEAAFPQAVSHALDLYAASENTITRCHQPVRIRTACSPFLPVWSENT